MNEKRKKGNNSKRKRVYREKGRRERKRIKRIKRREHVSLKSSLKSIIRRGIWEM